MPGINDLDFKKVDEPLRKLLKKFANLIDREWPSSVSREAGTHIILHSFILVAQTTYRTIIWVCAEKPDLPGRDPVFVLSVPPLTRALLDQVFTLCFLSENVLERSLWYFKAGWREIKEKDALERARYASDESWKEVLSTNLGMLEKLGELANVTPAERDRLAQIKRFPNPGRMHESCGDRLKHFLIFLNDWFYKQLSQEAHLSATGLITTAFPQVLVHNGSISESMLQERLLQVRSNTVVATITLTVALISEMQGIIKFPLISQELTYLWTLLGKYWKDPDDLYTRRYQSLLGS